MRMLAKWDLWLHSNCVMLTEPDWAIQWNWFWATGRVLHTPSHILDQVLLKRRKRVRLCLCWTDIVQNQQCPHFQGQNQPPIPNLWYTLKWIVGAVVFAAYVQLRKGCVCVCACAFCIFMQICACAQSRSISCSSGNIALLWVGLQKHSNSTPQNIRKQNSDSAVIQLIGTMTEQAKMCCCFDEEPCIRRAYNYQSLIGWWGFCDFHFSFSFFRCCEAFCNLSMLW